MDFAEPAAPQVRRQTFSPRQHGLCLFSVHTGGSHADLTGQYAAIPAEMKEVAACFDRQVLRQVPEDLFQRIKDYLQRNNMTQRQFLLGLIEDELEREQTERESQNGTVNDNLEQDEGPAFDNSEADSDEDEDKSEDDDQGFTMGM